jgi:hypothetical protein
MTNITFNWNIKKIKVDPLFSGVTNYITTVEYEYVATDGKYTAVDSGYANLPSPQSQEELDGNFVDYDSLTPEQVISWIETNCFGEGGLEAIQSVLIDKINLQKSIQNSVEVEIDGEIQTLISKPVGTVEKEVPWNQ